MERAKCALDPSHAAQFFCECTKPPLLLCLQCVEPHTRDAKSHPIQRLNLLPAPPRSSHLCACGQPSEEMCLCVFPIPTFCRKCRATHINQAAATTHTSLPAHLREKFQSEQDLLQARQRLLALTVAECFLKQNVTAMEVCERRYKSKCADLKSRAKEYCSEQLESLRRVKAVLTAHLDSDLGKVTEQVVDSEPAKGLGQLIRSYMTVQNPDTLSLFRFEQKAPRTDLTEVFGIHWESRLDSEGDLLRNFAIPDCSEGLEAIYRTIDPLLSEENEEKYVSAFTQELVTKLPDKVASRDSLHEHQEEARVRFYHQHYSACLARDQAFEEVLAFPDRSSMAIAIFTRKAGLVHAALVAKYGEELRVAIETAMQMKQELEALHAENRDLRASINQPDGQSFMPRKRGRGRGRGRGSHSAGTRHKHPNGFHLFAHEISTDKSRLEASKEELAAPGSFLKVASRMWRDLSEREQEDWKKKAAGEENEGEVSAPSKRLHSSSSGSESQSNSPTSSL